MSGIAEDFLLRSALCEGFADKFQQLLADLLAAESIRVHSVTRRVKSKGSFERKLRDKPGKYQSIDDVTDILGLRVITNFKDDVDRVAEIIEREYLVDRENSIDKRVSSDPDRFGYASLHYVVSLSEQRSGLTENALFGKIKFEIQVRSILQHAWAEIEHDLGYKSRIEIPSRIVRRFSRLAGLLELADDEFAGTRDEAVAYGKDVRSNIAGQNLSEVELDIDSLSEYIASGAVSRIDATIAANIGRTLGSDIRLYLVGMRLAELRDLGYDSILNIENDLNKYGAVIASVATYQMTEAPKVPDVAEDSDGSLVVYDEDLTEALDDFWEDDKDVTPGISLFYLTLLKKALSYDPDDPDDFNVDGMDVEDFVAHVRSAVASMG